MIIIPNNMKTFKFIQLKHIHLEIDALSKKSIKINHKTPSHKDSESLIFHMNPDDNLNKCKWYLWIANGKVR